MRKQMIYQLGKIKYLVAKNKKRYLYNFAFFIGKEKMFVFMKTRLTNKQFFEIKIPGKKCNEI